MSEGEIQRLGAFMSGPERPTYARMIDFFSTPGKYLHPREIEYFRNSMTHEEWIDFKVEFWDYIAELRMAPYTPDGMMPEMKQIIAVLALT